MVWTYTWAAIFFLFFFASRYGCVHLCVYGTVCLRVCYTGVLSFYLHTSPLTWETYSVPQTELKHTRRHTRTPKLLESFRRRKWHTRGPQIQCSKLTNREHLRVMWSKEIKTYLTEKWSDKSHICYNDLSARHEDWNVVHKMAAS